jgi:hypothetical protein
MSGRCAPLPSDASATCVRWPRTTRASPPR